MSGAINVVNGQAVSKIKTRFGMLENMVVAENWRGLIVYGPPGIGKTYNILEYLKKLGVRHRYADGRMTPQYLVEDLWQTRGDGFVLVLDDMDGLFKHPEAMSVLKGCLDSTDERWVRYKVQNKYLQARNITQEFEYHGRVIMLTNHRWELTHSARLREDVQALHSRCRSFDMEVEDANDVMIWTEHVIRTTDILHNLKISLTVQEEIIEFMWDNVSRFKKNETGLRGAKKVGEYVADFPNDWKDYVSETMIIGS